MSDARIGAALVEHVAAALGMPARGFTAVSTGPGIGPLVPDASFKWWVNHADLGPQGFGLVSPPEYPNSVKASVDGLLNLRKTGLASITSVTAPPLATGVAEGRSFAIFPVLFPVARRLLGRVQLLTLRRRVGRWLRTVATETRSAVNDSQATERFRTCLSYCASEPQLSASVRRVAELGLARLEARRWVPRSVLMHGDLWRGNLMFRRRRWVGTSDFVLIDWGSAVLEGYPILDLCQCATSLRLSASDYQRELAAHAEILECEEVDTASCLLAGIGHIGLHLDNYPKDRWLAQAETLMQHHRLACNAGQAYSS